MTMEGVNYEKVKADIVVAMLPLVYKEEGSKDNNLVTNRERSAVNKVVEIADYVVNKLKGGRK